MLDDRSTACMTALPCLASADVYTRCICWKVMSDFLLQNESCSFFLSWNIDSAYATDLRVTACS